MPESQLYDLPPSEAGVDQCPRCGRLFEPAVEIEVDGKPQRIRGHVQGDPVLCVPLPGMAELRGPGRDGRTRKANRRVAR
jgi:hypothetical protein